MNRNLNLLAGLVLVSGMALAQAPSNTGTPSNDVRGAAGGAASQTNQTTDKVLNKQAATDTTKTAAPAPPAGGTKVAPEPKTKEEEAAMKAVIAKANDPAAMQTAADEFSTKFPDSNVRGMLYRQLMLVYEQQGNADKSYEAGRKSLTFDPDDPLTLADCSMYLSSHTHDSDLDKDERLAEAKKMANEAITNIDQLRLNAQSAPEERAKVKQFVTAQAYSALAIAAQAAKDWPTAEANYTKSVESNPDPATILRLGFAQRMQNKLEPALASFNKAIDTGKASQSDTVVQIAQQQKDSVEKQIAKQKGAPAATPAATPAAAPTTAPTTPKQ
jgi:tetratricopeptide (TPR) repeat protein